MRDDSGKELCEESGVDCRRVEEEYRREIKPYPESDSDSRRTEKELPYTPTAKRSIEHALEYAKQLKQNKIDIKCLFYGVVREENGVGSMILANTGFHLDLLNQNYKKDS